MCLFLSDEQQLPAHSLCLFLSPWLPLLPSLRWTSLVRTKSAIAVFSSLTFEMLAEYLRVMLESECDGVFSSVEAAHVGLHFKRMLMSVPSSWMCC